MSINYYTHKWQGNGWTNIHSSLSLPLIQFFIIQNFNRSPPSRKQPYIMRVTKTLKIASSSRKNSKSVIMTNFQFSKSLKGSTTIIHFMIVKMYQSVTEYRPLHHMCNTYQLCHGLYGFCYSLSSTEAYHRHAAARLELKRTVLKILLL